ncbi:hypothetical protein PCANC_04034 [Puccinia coronata f. sp. avenae]|uniref:Uncharacterized protein n=1 Tax=Puccinia coronata f. sp. avenae TaxID=200324 RepID=A0A2N5W243_9BASI|nr:hypothetical protein PCANC_04034 [Puccinia coronata f. sp. avenae]
MTKGDQPHTGTQAGTQVPAHFVPKVDAWYRTRHRLAGTGGPNPVYRRYMTCFTSGPTTSLTRSWPDRTVHDLPTKQVMGRLVVNPLVSRSLPAQQAGHDVNLLGHGPLGEPVMACSPSRSRSAWSTGHDRLDHGLLTEPAMACSVSRSCPAHQANHGLLTEQGGYMKRYPVAFGKPGTRHRRVGACMADVAGTPQRVPGMTQV